MIPHQFKMVQPPLYKGAVCAYPWDPLLAQRYTIPSRYDDDEPMRMYRRINDQLIGLPWNCCPPGGEDRRSDGWAINVQHSIVARSADQARVQTEAWELLQAGHSFIIQSPTGTGKTVTALKLLVQRGRNTLVIVPKEDLLDQWVERALAFTSLKKEDIGRIQGDVVQVKGRPLVLGSLQSLAKPDRYPPWVYEHFGLIVFDEVHRLGAEYFGEVACKFTARQRLGLSATPTRKDGKDLLFRAHIGPIAVVGREVAMRPKIVMMQSPWRCPRNKNGERIPHKPGRITHILKSVCSSGARNRGLCQIAAEGFRRGRKVLIFSAHVEHLETLESMLPGYGVPPGMIGRYYGSMTKQEMAQAEIKPMLLATYGKMAEGTDIPHLDMAILGTPLSDPTQAIGRVVRTHPGKPTPLVFDPVDVDSPVIRNYAKGRLKVYKAIEAEVVEADFPT